MSAPAVGLSFQPDERFLDLLGEAFARDVDYAEVAPETLWRFRPDGTIGPNGFHALLRGWKARTGKAVVAHGVGLSLGTVSEVDDARRARWLERIREDHAVLDFLWYSDHLGATSLDGRSMALPLPVPMTAARASAIRARLGALQRIVPDVGLENTASYFLLGTPAREAAFLGEVLDAPRMHLVLDLHNLRVMALNMRFDARAHLDRLPLERVIEIHVSGGAESDPAWLASGRSMRLDGHDGPVPEAVWTLLDHALDRCPNVRGVTLERMEGTVEPHDVEPLRAELQRVREMVGRGSRVS